MSMRDAVNALLQTVEQTKTHVSTLTGECDRLGKDLHTQSKTINTLRAENNQLREELERQKTKAVHWETTAAQQEENLLRQKQELERQGREAADLKTTLRVLRAEDGNRADDCHFCQSEMTKKDSPRWRRTLYRSKPVWVCPKCVVDTIENLSNNRPQKNET